MVAGNVVIMPEKRRGPGGQHYCTAVRRRYRFRWNRSSSISSRPRTQCGAPYGSCHDPGKMSQVCVRFPHAHIIRALFLAVKLVGEGIFVRYKNTSSRACRRRRIPSTCTNPSRGDAECQSLQRFSSQFLQAFDMAGRFELVYALFHQTLRAYTVR